MRLFAHAARALVGCLTGGESARKRRPFAVLTVLLLLPVMAKAQDGELDPTFEGGVLSIESTRTARFSASAAVSGGRLLVAGLTAEVTEAWSVWEITESGQFAAPWTQQFEPINLSDEGAYTSSVVHAVGRDDWGRTLVLGRTQAGEPAMVRLLGNAAPDPAFDGNGIRVITSSPAGWGEIEAVEATILPSGGFAFAGRCYACAGGADGAFVLRLFPDGSPDYTFSEDGWMSFAINGLGLINPTAIRAEAGEPILLAAHAIAGGVFAARVLSSGTLDPTFGGGDGISERVELDPPRRSRGVAIDPVSDRTYVAVVGQGDDQTLGGVLAFDAAGALDPTFAGTGFHDLDLESGTGIEDVFDQSDGRILAAGSIDATGEPVGDFFLARLLPTGVRDASFDGNGVKRVPIDRTENAYDEAQTIALWGGRMVAVGRADADGLPDAFAVVRTTSALIFTDGFERGSFASWNRN